MAEHVYCGSGKEKTFSNGSIIEITIPIDELMEHAKTYGFTSNGGRRLVRLKVGSRRQVGQYGETHTVEVDTWKPTPGATGSGASGSTPGRYPSPFPRASAATPSAAQSGSNPYTRARTPSAGWPATTPAAPPASGDDFPDDIPF